MSIPLAILMSKRTDLTLTQAIHMSAARTINDRDTLALSLPPYEHQYSHGNTHIYAYGSHSYLGNTHVSGADYK